MVRVFIPDNTSTKGAGLTGLTNASANLAVVWIREFDAAVTSYSGANIETITTIGTYQAPSASTKIRFKEVDATNLPGVYELHFHDSAAAFGSGDNSTDVVINILETSTSALNIGPNQAMIPLVPWDPQDAVRLGLTALPNAAAGADTGLPVVDAAGKVAATVASGDAEDIAPIATGTAQSGGPLGITLHAGDTAPDGFYIGCLLYIASGAGAGQSAVVRSYTASSKTLTCGHGFVTTPDNTSVYRIYPTDLPYTQATGILAAVGDVTAAITVATNMDKTGYTLDAAYDAAKTAAQASDMTTLLGRLTAARAGYLDNLNVGGAVASHADITAINASASKHLTLATVPQYEPGETYWIELNTFNATTGALVNADSTPTLAATGIVSGDLSANLSAATNPATGVYRWTYTPGASPTLEQIRFDASATIAGSTFPMSAYAQTVNEATVVWTSTDQTHLTAIYNKLPTNNLADETLVLSAIGTPMQAGDVTLAASQPNYAPAKAGDAMTLTGAYDAAKTAAQAGDAMDLVSTALDAIIVEPAAGSLPDVNARQALALAVDVLAAVLSGAGPGGGPITIRNLGDTVNRLVTPCDSNGNRTAITVFNPPA